MKNTNIQGYVGAGIVFWFKDELDQVYVLLGKRKFGIERGRWSIPGGGLDSKDGKDLSIETFKKIALRESFEEVYFDVRDPKKLHEIWSVRSLVFNWSTFAVKCKRKISVRKYHEFSKMKWFRVDKVPERKVLFLAGQLRSLVKLLSKV